MKTSVNTLKKHLPFIENSLLYPYNNGRIEGINNKIKVLNRVAYGYRNFSNFKNRIMLHFKLKPVGRKMGQEYNETHPHGANVHKDVCLILRVQKFLFQSFMGWNRS